MGVFPDRHGLYLWYRLEKDIWIHLWKDRIAVG